MDEKQLQKTNEKLRNSSNPEPLATILGVKNPNTAHPSKFKPCEICETRDADGLLGRVCHVCQNKVRFARLPAEQQLKELLVAIPARYVAAKMENVPEAITKDNPLDIDSGLLLWGGVGTGKTYTMAAFAKHFIEEGFTVKREHYDMLCLKLRDTYNPATTTTEYGFLSPYLECDKLFIEDVGTGKSIGKKETDFSTKVFYLLLEIRLENMKPTFITSNKSLENLAKNFDGRIGDRLRMFKIYKLTGKSKRGQTQGEQ